MNIASRTVDELKILDVQEPCIDFRNFEAFKHCLQAEIKPEYPCLVLNLKEVSFMDSSGLSVVLYAKRLGDEQHVKIVLCSLQPYVKNLVMVTQIQKSIDVVDSLAELSV